MWVSDPAVWVGVPVLIAGSFLAGWMFARRDKEADRDR